MEDKRMARMKELVMLLNEASKAYYSESREIMTNFRYDELYDELEGLEKELGVVLSGSPTVKVGYEVSSSLPKERHASPMLSLSKTKDREELVSWLGDREGILSWKLDGLTIVLTYEGGELVKAVTRGNGEVGEVITANARCFANLPHRIAYKGRLVVRGEAVISYKDFERINALISDDDSKYRNPRNLCSGSVRTLDPAVTKQRNVRLVAFALVSAEENGEELPLDTMESRFDFLSSQGFEVVRRKKVTAADLIAAIEDFERAIPDNPYPSDGLVLLYDDVSLAQSLGRTAKAPRNAIAFKWKDETADTKLLYVEWSPSRTGLINPVAVFESVELEGTSVSRASVHNVSIVKELELGEGDIIRVYKANMIIPQIAENLTRSGTLTIPDKCPACGGRTVLRAENDTQTLFCENPDCVAKQIKSFDQLCSRDGLNIEGLSEKILERLIGLGFIHEFSDIYHLDRYAGEIKELEGFGEKSCENLLSGIEASRETTLSAFLYALGIPGVGVAVGKLLSRHFDGRYDVLEDAQPEDFSAIDGVGSVMAADIRAYFDDDRKRGAADRLFKELSIKQEAQVMSDSPVSGLTFVITGSLSHFENRDELKAFIEERGGKVTGSVTSKTDYLINNNISSASGKNKKAKELGVKIISEEDFLGLAGE